MGLNYTEILGEELLIVIFEYDGFDKTKNACVIILLSFRQAQSCQDINGFINLANNVLHLYLVSLLSRYQCLIYLKLHHRVRNQLLSVYLLHNCQFL